MTVPVFAVGFNSVTFLVERLLVQTIFNFPFPSQVTHSNFLEKIFAALIPTPLAPIEFLSSSKLVPDIGTQVAITGIHSPLSFFSTGIPVPLSSQVNVSFVIVISIFVDFSQLVFIPTSTELSIASLQIFKRPSVYEIFLKEIVSSSFKTQVSFSEGETEPIQRLGRTRICSTDVNVFILAI